MDAPTPRGGPDMETLAFFQGHREAFALYRAFEELLLRTFPNVEKRVLKTQISFYGARLFACVSFARVKPKAQLPPGYMVITLGLPGPLDSDRVAVRVEARPNRWTHHIVVGGPEDLDGELISWIREAYAFSEAKRGRRSAGKEEA